MDKKDSGFLNILSKNYFDLLYEATTFLRAGGWDNEFLSNSQGVGIGECVGINDVLDGDAKFLGDAKQGVAALDDIGRATANRWVHNGVGYAGGRRGINS